MLSIPTIRLATAMDSAFIAEMSRDAIEAGLNWSWTQPRVLRAILDRSTNVAVICGPVDRQSPAAKNRVLGFGIMQYGDDWAHLALLAVDSAHRRRGLATQVMTWLEMPARAAGIQRFRVEARVDNPGAIAFYLGLGFRESGRIPRYYQGTLDAIRLEKNQTSPA